MRRSAVARWLLLATLWSLQYIFMRMSVPVFGTGIVAESRGFFSALFLVPWVIFVMRESIGLREHWRDHLAVTLVNNVLPFLCFAWAATELPASYLAVMNGMVPLWSGIIAAPVLKERLGPLHSGVASLPFFTLVRDIGPTRTLTVGLAIPVLGIFWGWLLLGEIITLSMLGGAALVLLALALVMRN